MNYYSLIFFENKNKLKFIFIQLLDEILRKINKFKKDPEVL